MNIHASAAVDCCFSFVVVLVSFSCFLVLCFCFCGVCVCVGRASSSTEMGNMKWALMNLWELPDKSIN